MGQPRAIDVVAGATPTKVLSLDRDSFQRLLGKLNDLLTHRANEYTRTGSDLHPAQQLLNSKIEAQQSLLPASKANGPEEEVQWTGVAMPKLALESARLLLEEEDAGIGDCLRLRILSVKGLRPSGADTTLNPYVTAKFGCLEQRTTTLHGEIEPRWEDEDYELVYPMHNGAEALELEVLHQRSIFESCSLARADVATWAMVTNQ